MWLDLFRNGELPHSVHQLLFSLAGFLSVLAVGIVIKTEWRHSKARLETLKAGYSASLTSSSNVQNASISTHFANGKHLGPLPDEALNDLFPDWPNHASSWVREQKAGAD